MSTQVQLVSFYNHQITKTNLAEEMRSVVESILLNLASQFKRIQSNKILNSRVVMITTVAKDGRNRELIYQLVT